MKTNHYPVPGALAEALVSVVSVAPSAEPGVENTHNHFPAMGWCVLTFFFEGAVALPHDTSAADAGRALPRWLLSGPRTKPVTSTVLEPVSCIAALFFPDAFAQLTGIAPGNFRDDDVAAERVLPASWKAWPIALEKLANNPDEQFRWIVAWLTPHWLAGCDQWASAAPEGLAASLRHLGRGNPDAPAPTIAELAQSLQMSERQLHRRTRQATGLSPVQLQRIQRAQNAFLRAREALKQGRPLRLAELALDCGFADQAHLTREIRALCGQPAAKLLMAVQTEEDFWPFRL